MEPHTAPALEWLPSRCEQSVTKRIAGGARCTGWEHLLLRRANHQACDATINEKRCIDIGSCVDIGWRHTNDVTTGSDRRMSRIQPFLDTAEE